MKSSTTLLQSCALVAVCKVIPNREAQTRCLESATSNIAPGFQVSCARIPTKKERKKKKGVYKADDAVHPIPKAHSHLSLSTLHIGHGISLQNLTIFSQNHRAISRTTEPILGLFVLIWKHISCWIQIWRWAFKMISITKDFNNFEKNTRHLISTFSWRGLILPSWLQICLGKGKIWNYLHKIQGAILRTTEPNTGLFVLIWMHFSCWIQIWI